MNIVILIHLSTALAALVLGPFIFWTRTAKHRQGRSAHIWNQIHRGTGLVWVGLMVATGVSALLIRSETLPNIMGFSPIHLLVPFTFISLFMAFRYLRKGQVRGHRLNMIGLYFGACVGAGAFTLLPNRLLGQIVWGEWLGWL